MAGEIKSMAEHSDLLLYLVGVLISGGIIETVRRLTRMEKKQDEQVKCHEACRKELLLKADFAQWILIVFKPWQDGRDGPQGLWYAINHHSHEGIPGSGKVIKT